MKIRKYLIVIICTVGLLSQSFSRSPETISASETPEDKDYALVVNAPLEAVLVAGETSSTIQGTINLYLETSPQELESGTVKVRGFNLVFADVPQKILSGKTTPDKTGTALTTLGIPMHSTDDIQLKLDAEHQKFRGFIPVQAYFPQMDEIFPPNSFDESGANDYSISQAQQGNIEINIKADVLLEATADWKKISQVTGISSWADINIEPLTIGEETIPGYTVKFTATQLSVQAADLKTSSVTRHFCVQPVGISDAPNDPNKTGKSFVFGRPAIHDLWETFGVIIDVKPDWIYLKPDWKLSARDDGKVVNEIQAQKILKIAQKTIDAKVHNCIGVIFVKNFDQVYLNGGGWAIKTNTSEPEIITSDGNMDQRDCTHLAHEMGHAFGLRHPKDTNTSLMPSDEGTLMCPSGWHFQNPYKNSDGNISKVLHGTFVVAPRAPVPKYLCQPHNPLNLCGLCTLKGSSFCPQK